MPLTVGPDPANPGKWIWVDSATGQPATQPGGPGTPFVTADQVPAAANIDPNASRGPTTQPFGPPSPGTGTTPPVAPTIGTPQGANGMFTVDQATDAASKEVQAANVDAAKVWNQVNEAKNAVDKAQAEVTAAGAAASPAQTAALTSATSTLNQLYQLQSQSQQRIETANAAYSTALTKAIDQNLVDPSQIALARSQAAKADADAATARAQAQVLTDGAPGQRALVAAQAGQASAAAAAQQATADATKAKTPAEVNQLNAQAAALTAQANQANALLPGLIDKQKAETGLTQAQTDLTGSQSALAQAQAVAEGARGRLADAQATLTGVQGAQLVPAQAAFAQAQAGTELAKQKQALLGPMYGLQDQLNAIRTIQQQVFGPGGSGNAEDANKLLQDYVTATVSGTTPYAASVAAANYGQNIFGTQAALANAAQSAAASRANALMSTGANVLGTLAQMNANAPAGSTAMAGAFNEVMNQMMSRGGGQQAFAPPTLPQAPALPALLSRFGQPAGTPAMPAPQPAAAPAAAAAPNAGAGAVNINIGTSGQGQPPPAAPTQSWTPPGANYSYQGPPPWAGATPQPLPSLLQQYAPITDVGQLGAAMSKIWGYS